MKSLAPNKFILATLLIILAATFSYGQDDLLSLSITIKTPKPGQPIASSPHEITINPYKKNLEKSLTVFVGEELIVNVTNPNGEFYNGNFDAQGPHSIWFFWNTTDWGGYDNFFFQRQHLKDIDFGYRTPLFFHYKFPYEGSIELDFEKGEPDGNTGGM